MATAVSPEIEVRERKNNSEHRVRTLVIGERSNLYHGMVSVRGIGDIMCLSVRWRLYPVAWT